MKFESISQQDIDWSFVDSLNDRYFTQRLHWLNFIKNSCKGKIVHAVLIDDSGAHLGYFSGVLFNRFGVKILGSPFIGWTTPYIGFNLIEDIPRLDVFYLFEKFAFNTLKCKYFELSDRGFTLSDAETLGYEYDVTQTFTSDLSVAENEIFATMSSACRRCIRKAKREGVSIEQAAPEHFASEYYQHLTGVFAKQGLKPTYSLNRVQQLIDSVYSSGDLLLLRAKNPDGLSIATGIYCGFNQQSFFWGNGSLRQHQILRPNELLHWEAMRYWKSKGIQFHEWGGAGDYKRKYGGKEFYFYKFKKSTSKIASWGYNVSKKFYYQTRRYLRKKHLNKLSKVN